MGWMNTLKSIGYFHIDVHWSPLDNHKRRNCNMMNDKFHRSNRDCHSRNHWQFSGICRQQSLWDRCIWSCWSDRCKHRHFYMDWSYIRRYQCGNSFRWNLLTKEKRKMNSSSRSLLLQSSLLPFLQLQFTLLIIWWTPKTCCWDGSRKNPPLIKNFCTHFILLISFDLSTHCGKLEESTQFFGPGVVRKYFYWLKVESWFRILESRFL